MMTVLLKQPSSVRKVQIARLPKRYGIPFPELFERFSQLEIQPDEIDGALCVDDLQLEQLDELHISLQGSRVSLAIAYGLGETFLYRCNHCGDLWLVDTPLHTHSDQLRVCGKEQEAASFHIGRFEFIASGPHEEIVGLAHSIALGLDTPMKGI